MYISLRQRHTPYPTLFRWCGRAGGVILVLAWAILVALEMAKPDAVPPSVHACYQAVALAVVFAGYALGWRKELAGGVLVVIGTMAFFAVHYLTSMGPADPSAAWFAAPGVLYLLAWKYGGRGHDVTAPR
jgi:hypothetical protein